MKAFSQPKAATVKAVTDWLTESGVSDITPFGAFDDWLSITLPVETANTLFDTQFSTYVHVASGERVVRTLEYSLPVDLFEHIEVIHPTTSFARASGGPLDVATIPVTRGIELEERANSAPSSCNSTVTPACLQALYAIPATPATETDNELAVMGFIEQWANVRSLIHVFLIFVCESNGAFFWGIESRS